MQSSAVRVALGVLLAASTVVVVTAVAVAPFLTPAWVTFEQRRTGAAALTGFSDEQVAELTPSILHDLVVGPPDFAQAVDGRPVFNDRERAHLRDVRGVFLGFGALALLGAITLVNGRLVSRGAAWLRRSVAAGAVVLGVAVVGGAALVTVAFDQVFEAFHRLFFAGGTYRFDPATDRLVQLFPEAFWEETAIAVGVVILGISLLVAGWGLRRRDDR